MASNDLLIYTLISQLLQDTQAPRNPCRLPVPWLHWLPADCLVPRPADLRRLLTTVRTLKLYAYVVATFDSNDWSDWSSFFLCLLPLQSAAPALPSELWYTTQHPVSLHSTLVRRGRVHHTSVILGGTVTSVKDDLPQTGLSAWPYLIWEGSPSGCCPDEGTPVAFTLTSKCIYPVLADALAEGSASSKLST